MLSFFFGAALLGALCFWIRSLSGVTHDARFFQVPGAAAGAAWLALLMLPALADAIPANGTTLLDAILKGVFTAGVREAAGSLPLAVTDLTGAALAATADTVPAGHTPTLYAVRTTLVAMIVGGVSIAAAWLLAASLCAKKRGKGLVDGMDHLSNRDGTFPWRGPMLVVSLAWLFLSWVLLLWPDWHVFGTDASGQDVLGVLLKGLLPGFGAAALLGLSGFVFFRANPFSERWPRGAAVFAPVGVAFGAASVVTASGASLFGTPQLLLAGDAVTLLFAFLFWGLAALAALRVARAVR